LDKIKIAGGEKMSSNVLYTFDRDMGETSEEVTAAEDVTSENP
ncbi:MAG: putative nucleic-acid-binding protein, partial [Cyclobacteriaceae bacterium]